MFSYEYCKISNNTCFEEHLRTAASENNNKERFLGKATSHNDHYMVNMGGQRPKIGDNWHLTAVSCSADIATPSKLKQWKYLEDIMDKICNRDISVGLLIGANSTKALEPLKGYLR